MNSQDNMSLPKIRTHIIAIPEKINLADTEGNHFKIAIINMFKELIEGMSKCLNEDLGNTNTWNNHANNSRYEKRIE